MKKFLTVFVLAVFMVTSAFATTANMTPVSTKPGEDVKSTVDVALDIKVSDMYSYAFGFSGAVESSALENEDLTMIPTTAVDGDGTLNLVFDKASSTASNSGKDLYLFYKIQAPKEEIKLKINPSVLTDSNSDLTVNMTVSNSNSNGAVKVGNDDALNFSATSGAPATISLTPSIAGQMMYGSIKLDVKTAKIPPLKQTAAFTGTIELFISAS